ncbi:MAG: alpha-L-arabinofuranosidase [Limisphaerales bacterium]
MRMFRNVCVGCGWALALLVSGPRSSGQAPLPIYTDHLVNGFQDWSWAPHSLSNTAPVHSGANSISVSATAWQALALEQAGFDATLYAGLVFWAHGGSAGGQVLQVSARFGTSTGPGYALPALAANTWKQCVVPLSDLGAVDATSLNGFNIALSSGGAAGTFYLDDVEMTPRPAPALTHLSVDAASSLRTADTRWFGLNTAIWDSDLDTPQTVSLLEEMGTSVLRFPGGSISDEYHWSSNTTGTNTWAWATSFNMFARVAANAGAQAFITVNYGSGTADEAANWVRCSNVTNRYGLKYWEIGNENYGTWETDQNTYPNDAYTYATRAADYMARMKAVDPTIKVGVVVTPGEDSSINGYTNHPATNALTGQVHYGWTPVLLSTLRALGVVPDFLIHHVYPEWTAANSIACSDSDPFLLQSTTVWAGDAADLRRQLTAYMGPAGAQVELVCTENNSDAGAQGRQSTSLVNGLYYADSLAQLMKTEFNGFIWWDLRNGSDTTGSFDPTLYGWRTVGDLGVVGGLTNRYPVFYAAKLMQYFARPGDAILNASSDYKLLSVYAARRADGALSCLVLNKDTLASFNAQIALTGFTPGSAATVRSYGIPQDTAAQTGLGSPDIAQTNFVASGTNIAWTFAPLSMTLFTLAPAAPRLSVVPPAPLAGATVLVRLQGQPGTTYIIQSSTNLASWTSVSTNALGTNATLLLSQPLPAASRHTFWRAFWPGQ